MKLRQQLVERTIAGEHIFVAIKSGENSYEGMLTTDEVGAFILQKLQDNITFEQMLSDIMGEFEVGEEQATDDLNEFIAQLRDNGILTE